MHKATKHADRPHARIYHHWLDLPAWKAMRGEAQLLLVHMLATFRPAFNSRLEWPLTRVQEVLRCGRSTASEALTDLEKNGWVKVCRVGRFSGSRKPSLYRLTMFGSEIEDLPKTEEFLRARNPPRPGRNKNLSGSKKALLKSVLKPEQVPLETASGKIQLCTANEASDQTAIKINRSRQGERAEPKASEKLRTQLLIGTAVARPRPSAGDQSADDAFGTAQSGRTLPANASHKSSLPRLKSL
ncbi:MAG TPA: hypothetical protein VIF02_04135 [Methylocella sp.]